VSIKLIAKICSQRIKWDLLIPFYSSVSLIHIFFQMLCTR
jgi:hypothetical protein